MNEQELIQEREALHTQLTTAAEETQNGANLEGLQVFPSTQEWVAAQARYTELGNLIHIAAFQLPDNATVTVVAPPTPEAVAAADRQQLAQQAGEQAAAAAQATATEQVTATPEPTGATASSGATEGQAGAQPEAAGTSASATGAATAAAPINPAAPGQATAAAADASTPSSAGDATEGQAGDAPAVLAPRPASEANDVRQVVDGLLANAQAIARNEGETLLSNAMASLRAQTIAGSLGNPGAMMAHDAGDALAEQLFGPVWDRFQNDIQAMAGYIQPYNVGALAAAVNMPITDVSRIAPDAIPLPPMMRRTLFDIVPKQTNRRGIEVKVRLLSETGREGAAAPVEQAAPIPESAYEFKAVNDLMETVAEFTPFKLRDLQLDRAIFVATAKWALGRLERRVEAGIARGDGNDPQLKGLMTSWGIPSFEKPTGLSTWQYLIRAYYKVFEDHEANPTHIVLHPEEWAKLLTNTGLFGSGSSNEATSNNNPIWESLKGLFQSEISPIIISKQLDATDKGKALVGDFSMCKYYEYPELINKMVQAYMYTIPTQANLPTGGDETKFVPPATAEHLMLATTGTLVVTYQPGFLTLDLN